MVGRVSGAASPIIDEDVQVGSLMLRRSAQILYGAVLVIAREGVVAAKLKDIAREAGVSLGLVQHYFDTRDNLVNEACQAMMRLISQEGDRRLEGDRDPLRLLFALNRLHVYGAIDFPRRWGFWSELWARSGRSEPMREVAAQVYELWERPLREALDGLEGEGRLPAGVRPADVRAALTAPKARSATSSLSGSATYAAAFMLKLLDEQVVLQLRMRPEEVERMLRDLR